MTNPPYLLCIIVPTYNRAPHLRRLLAGLQREVEGLSAQLQFVIGDNASEDGTEAITAEFARAVPNVTVLRHASNVGPDENFCACIERATAHYFWIIGDDDLVRPGALKAVVLPVLAKHQPNLLYLASDWSSDAAADAAAAPPLRLGDGEVTLRSPHGFAARVNVWVTYISGMIVKTEAAGGQPIRRYTGTNLVQLGWVLPALARPQGCVATVETVCLFATAGNTGGYRLLTVFGQNSCRSWLRNTATARISRCPSVACCCGNTCRGWCGWRAPMRGAASSVKARIRSSQCESTSPTGSCCAPSRQGAGLQRVRRTSWPEPPGACCGSCGAELTQPPAAHVLSRLRDKLRRESQSEAHLWWVARIFQRFRNLALSRIRCFMLGLDGCYIGPSPKIIGSRHIAFGDDVSLEDRAWIEAVVAYQGRRYSPRIELGRGLRASPDLHIGAIGEVIVGEHCLFGSGVTVIDHNHGSYRGELASRPDEPPAVRPLVSPGRLVIGRNCWFGDRACVIGAVTIGEGCVIAANAVVVTDVPPHSIVAGIPARVVRRYSAERQQWVAASG